MISNIQIIDNIQAGATLLIQNCTHILARWASVIFLTGPSNHQHLPQHSMQKVNKPTNSLFQSEPYTVDSARWSSLWLARLIVGNTSRKSLARNSAMLKIVQLSIHCGSVCNQLMVAQYSPEACDKHATLVKRDSKWQIKNCLEPDFHCFPCISCFSILWLIAAGPGGSVAQ